jgi:hypothetical protein
MMVITLSFQKTRLFLKERGHQLCSCGGQGVTQLIVHTPKTLININRKIGEDTNSHITRGTLTAVSDPRKGGCPAAVY